MLHNVWIVERSGGPFRKTELLLPEPAANQVLVRIAASGVNPLDVKIRTGKAAHARQPLPAVLGLDMAGTVVQTGSGVTAFHRGDEVFGMVGGVGGLQGTLAEYIAADVDLLARRPKSLSAREAAGLPLSVITSWEALVERCGIHTGQKALIHAGAGGVGHIAIQIAQAFGAETYATVSPEKRRVVEKLGAVPIDYRSSHVEEYVAAHTNGKGFDIVFDTVGGATLDASFVAVKRYGHVVSALGRGTHSLAPLSLRGATYSGVFTLLPLITGEDRARHGKILARAAALANEGNLRPLLYSQRFSTADIEAAQAVVEKGSLGKVVVEL
jgi:NADPH:quinone reductase-like Zn-dependent oxidoreductase